MPEHTSRRGQRVDRVMAYEAHEKRQGVHPVTGEEVPDPGIPILSSSPVGQIVEKSIRAYTIKCPDCHVPAEYDDKASPVCPECGLICAGPHTIREERLVHDAKAAGRIEADSGSRSASNA